MIHCLAFDIEAIPDVDLGRRLYGIDDSSDEHVGEIMFEKRRAQTGGSDILPCAQQRVVAIAAVLRAGDKFNVWSLGSSGSPEAELVERFFAGIDKLQPTLVSWNGRAFDLPVLQLRALKHGVVAPRYWEASERLDLLEQLTSGQGREEASLDAVAASLGLPGKAAGMGGDRVWAAWCEGRIDEIRAHCETDALKTYLVFLRFELVRGRLSSDEYDAETARVYEWLEEHPQPHWLRFVDEWEPL